SSAMLGRNVLVAERMRPLIMLVFLVAACFVVTTTRCADESAVDTAAYSCAVAAAVLAASGSIKPAFGCFSRHRFRTAIRGV
ncbi:MAG: hypothetical protein ACRERD_01155, partial [Candidatus Binatia bacterium]